MRSIRLTRRDYDALRGHLFGGTGNEEAAFLTAGSASQRGVRELLVREVIPVPPSGLLSQGPCHLEIDPDLMAPIIKRCRNERLSLIDVHSHPGDGSVRFSGIDDAGNAKLLPKIKARIPSRDHASLVLNGSSINARIWLADGDGPEPIDRIVVVGQPLEVIDLNAAGGTTGEDLSAYDRQVLMFGREGQCLLGRTTVAVVGCGGLGSIIVQELAHLGIGRLLLIDSDLLERSNLSRVVGATPADVGLPKVEVAGRHAKRINRRLVVDAIQDTVLNEETALRLLAADIIVCGTDTVASRMVLNRLAFQYLRPLVDCGIEIKVTASGKAKVLGRVMTVLPDGPCLSCAGVIDPNVVAQELADPAHRARYVEGVPDPAVITLNGVVASLAATEVLDLVAGFKDDACGGAETWYCGQKGILRSRRLKRIIRCRTCRDVRAIGDGFPLPCTTSTGAPVLTEVQTHAQAAGSAERR